MPTPLYNALQAYADQIPLRFHMPGHKGKLQFVPEFVSMAKLDVTELEPTGNLYLSGPPFDQAQQLWAKAFGFEHAQFLTGGSTQGMYTALSLFCAPGDQVLLDRGCHRSAYHALALLGLEPVYLPRPWLKEEALTGPFSCEEIERILDIHPKVKTICITSPTYFGLLSNISAIAQVVHQRGGKLVVDGAHGAHLPFLEKTVFAGADAVVVSAHKTLPALGQGAVLCFNKVEVDRGRQMAALFGTSSPSYPILASLDLARDWMEGDGKLEYERVIQRVTALRRRFPGVGNQWKLDPGRFTIRAKNGFTLARELEKRGIYPEMADQDHVVFICTGCDSDADLNQLEKVLTELEELLGPSGQILPAPPLPSKVISLRQALFAPTRQLPLTQCEGKIVAQTLAPYPPGVPVVAPGEVVTKKELSYFKKIGYNNTNVQIVDTTGPFTASGEGERWI